MQREVKSFVLRAGRMSPRQQFGLEEALPLYQLTPGTSPWDLETVFGRAAETWVEIGFGMGASFFKMAQSHPLVNFIGIEVHRSGIGSLAADVFESGLTNVRIAPCDAQIVFKSGFNALSLDRINVFFPDPWPKKRHHKRRLIQSEFVGLLETKLKHGGVLHCATDWQAYADHMLTVLSQHAGLCNQDAAGRFIPRPDLRPMTKFEQRGLHLGHGVWDLLFIKK